MDLRKAMDLCLISVVYVLSLVLVSHQQAYPPGVPPPNQYQQQHQQHMPQQQHHVPQHHQQQVPMQQHHQPQMQQVPMQHQQPQMHQQQQMHMQQPPQQMHGGPPGAHPPQGGHHAHHGPPQVLNVANIQHEKEHIAEHLSVPVDTGKMSEQELQFHYFKMHDADNNNKLDGCELIKSLIHWHEQGSHVDPSTGQKAQVQEKLFKDDELVNLIDPILTMDDTNQDGFIDYTEFIMAQRKAAASGGPPPPKH